MAALFQSLGKTVIAGIVILAALLLIASSTGDSTSMSHAWGIFIMRWLHVLSGVMWIGLLGTSILYKYRPCQKFPMSINQQSVR